MMSALFCSSILTSRSSFLPIWLRPCIHVHVPNTPLSTLAGQRGRRPALCPHRGAMCARRDGGVGALVPYHRTPPTSPALSSDAGATGLGPMAREVGNPHGPLSHRDISPVVGGSDGSTHRRCLSGARTVGCNMRVSRETEPVLAATSKSDSDSPRLVR